MEIWRGRQEKASGCPRKRWHFGPPTIPCSNAIPHSEIRHWEKRGPGLFLPLCAKRERARPPPAVAPESPQTQKVTHFLGRSGWHCFPPPHHHAMPTRGGGGETDSSGGWLSPPPPKTVLAPPPPLSPIPVIHSFEAAASEEERKEEEEEEALLEIVPPSPSHRSYLV